MVKDMERRKILIIIILCLLFAICGYLFYVKFEEIVDSYKILLDDVIEKEVIIPETYQGYPVTHLGYIQDKTLAHVRDHDYHHPSQGSGDYYPTEYHPSANLFGPEFPITLKKFYIPKTIKEISYNFFEKMKDAPNLVIEIDPENPYFEVINNKIVRKK